MIREWEPLPVRKGYGRYVLVGKDIDSGTKELLKSLSKKHKTVYKVELNV